MWQGRLSLAMAAVVVFGLDAPQPVAAEEEAEPAPAAPAPDAPAQPEPPPAPPADAAGAEQLSSLQTELHALMDELVQARTRASLIGKTLFKTQVRVHVQNLAGDDTILAKIVLKLDGAPIFRGDGDAIRGDEERQVFEGFLAPGPHVFTAEVEQTSRDDSAYGYNLRESYKFQAIRDKRNELRLILRDDSDVASEFPDDQEGEYDIRTQLRVEAKELNEE